MPERRAWLILTALVAGCGGKRVREGSMMRRRGWPAVLVLAAGCGGDQPRPEPTSGPVAVAPAEPAAGVVRFQLPWPAADATRPVADAAGAIALVQAYYRAQLPDFDPTTDSYHATPHEGQWLVSVSRIPARPGSHVLAVVAPAGRVLEVIAGE